MGPASKVCAGIAIAAMRAYRAIRPPPFFEPFARSYPVVKNRMYSVANNRVAGIGEVARICHDILELRALVITIQDLGSNQSGHLALPTGSALGAWFATHCHLLCQGDLQTAGALRKKSVVLCERDR
jgi:hypothetical protein